MNDRWLPIPGFEGRYEVSDHGEIRALFPYRGQPGPRLLKANSKGAKDHLMVNLRLDGRRYPTLVHRAVLAAFAGPAPDDRPITRHMDGDPTNNHLANLRYGTNSENELDKVRHGTHQQASKTSCPSGHPYDGQNTYRSSKGRICRQCARERDAKPCPICGLIRTNIARHVAWHGQREAA